LPKLPPKGFFFGQDLVSLKGKQEGVEILWECPGNVGPSPLAIPTRRVWLGLLSFSFAEVRDELSDINKVDLSDYSFRNVNRN